MLRRREEAATSSKDAPFAVDMGRGGPSAVASWGDVGVHVGVVHLESRRQGARRGRARRRKRQLAAAGAELRGGRAPVSRFARRLQLGRPRRRVPLRLGLARRLGGSRLPAGAVRDGRANRMLSHRYQNRYDRVFVRQTRAVAGFALVGTARLPDLTITDRHKRLPAYPSDPGPSRPRASLQTPAAAPSRSRSRHHRRPRVLRAADEESEAAQQ